MFDFVRNFHTIFQSDVTISQPGFNCPTTFPALDVGSCIGFLLLHNRSPQMQHLQSTEISSQFSGSEVTRGSVGFSTQGLTRLKSKCRKSWLPLWRFRQNPLSGSVKLMVELFLKVKVSVSLVAVTQALSALPGVACISSHVDLSILKPLRHN